MVVHLDKISPSIQMQGSQQAAPARLPKGLSETPTTLNFAPQQKSSKSFMDSVRAFFASIWNFLTCYCRKESKETSADKTPSQSENSKSAPKPQETHDTIQKGAVIAIKKADIAIKKAVIALKECDIIRKEAKTALKRIEADKPASQSENSKSASKPQETPVETITKRVGDFIDSHLSDENLRCISQPEVRIAVIMTLDDKLLDCYFEKVQSSLFDFKKTATEKLEKILAQQSVRADSKIGIHTVIVEKPAAASFNVFTRHSSLSSFSTATQTSSKSSEGSGSALLIDPVAVAKVVMMHCGNNKEDAKAKAVYKFFGEGFKS